MTERTEDPGTKGDSPLTQIFHAARDLPPEERRAYIERACAEDAELLKELIPLIEALDTDAGRPDLDTGAVRSAIEAATAESGVIGRRIDDCELTELLGVGGMGAVYLGVRVDGGFEQRAAVKLLPMGMDTPVARWRFDEERRHLAALAHPSIAQIYGGGVTDDGTPYLIMEFVDGWPLDQFSDDNRLTVRQRLELFLSVCAAVQHAHERLVVHRDLKPSNVFITGEGVPKLLDFGIARGLDEHKRAPPGEVTRQGPAYTRAYSSPEQIFGEELTTAADVFSLGVVLYELLAGERPFGAALARDHEDAMRRFTRRRSNDHETADRRSVSPKDLRRTLKRDLSWIVGRAIRHNPEERYQTVAALARDIRQYLESRPVDAAPPSLAYRLERLVARRPTEVALGVLIVFFIGFSLAQTVQARLELQRARAFNQFISSAVLGLGPSQDASATTTLGETVDSALATLRLNPLGSEGAQADVLGAVGGAYLRLGRPSDARPLLQEATALRRNRARPDSTLAELHRYLGLAHLALASSDSAEHYLRSALEGYPRGPESADIRANIATLLDSLGARSTTPD